MEKTINCRQCGGPLQEHATFNALAEIRQTSTGFEMVRDKILPVVPHICGSCGYVELYLPKSALDQKTKP